MDFLPISLRLSGANVLLVGGGQVATRKARLLIKAGARLTVVAPQIGAELQQLLDSSGGSWQRDSYSDGAIADAVLVVAATPLRNVNEQVYRDATARRLPVNVVDSPDLCTFIFPAIVERGPLTVAISSGGNSPVLVRLLRRRIEAMVPAAYGRLARFAGRLRDTVKEAIPGETARRLFWEGSVEGAVGELVLAVVIAVVSGEDHQCFVEHAFLLQLGQHAATGGVHLGGEPVVVFHHRLKFLRGIKPPVPAVAAFVFLGEERRQAFP